MSAVGIFGGTFDPVHVGHLITAQAVREVRKLEKIIFIPAYVSPHKTEIPALDAVHRLNMLKLSLEGPEYFEFSDMEIKKEDISYSVETIRELKKKYHKLELIIGYDNIFDFKTWKEPDEIIKLVTLVVLRRKTSIEPDFKDKYYKAAVFVETPTIEISSSDIRSRVSKGLPVNYMVTDKVRKYINENNLYRE